MGAPSKPVIAKRLGEARGLHGCSTNFWFKVWFACISAWLAGANGKRCARSQELAEVNENGEVSGRCAAARRCDLHRSCRTPAFGSHDPDPEERRLVRLMRCRLNCSENPEVCGLSIDSNEAESTLCVTVAILSRWLQLLICIAQGCQWMQMYATRQAMVETQT